MIQFLKDEYVIAEVQRHWLPLLMQAIGLIAFGIAPFFLEGILYGIGGTAADFLADYASHIIILEAAWVLLLWMVFAVAWTNHYLDVLIITNKRVIDIDQIGLFKRDTAELSINNIEDIRVEMNGFIAHWFKFGTLELQTAAESKSFIIKNLQNPEQTRAILSKTHAEFLERQLKT